MGKVLEMRQYRVFALHRLICLRDRKGYTERASTVNGACHLDSPVKQVHEPLRDGQPQTITVGIGGGGLTLKRAEDA